MTDAAFLEPSFVADKPEQPRPADADHLGWLESEAIHILREVAGQCRHPALLLHAAVTLVLDDTIDVSRGDMLVHGDASPVTKRDLDATLCWLSEAPLDPRRSYLLHHTTREVRARIDEIDHLWDVATQAKKPAPDTLRMNDIGSVELKLAQPIFADRCADNRATGSFILIDEASNNTVAAGLIQ